MGDVWAIEPDLLVDVLRPAGDLRLSPSEMPEGNYVGLQKEDVVTSGLMAFSASVEEISGAAEATLLPGEDGLVVIELGLDVVVSAVHDDRIPELFRETGLTPSRVEYALASDWSCTGKGMLLWDLEGGHFRSFELTLDSFVEIDIGWLQPQGSSTNEIDMLVGLEAQTRLAASFED